MILFSGVLMYLEAPYHLLDRVRDLGFDYVLVDRTAFVAADSDIITVQKVPPSIFDATYPCWFFGLKRFLDFFADEYVLVAEFDGFEQANIPSSMFKGFILQRRHQQP